LGPPFEIRNFCFKINVLPGSEAFCFRILILLNSRTDKKLHGDFGGQVRACASQDLKSRGSRRRFRFGAAWRSARTSDKPVESLCGPGSGLLPMVRNECIAGLQPGLLEISFRLRRYHYPNASDVVSTSWHPRSRRPVPSTDHGTHGAYPARKGWRERGIFYTQALVARTEAVTAARAVMVATLEFSGTRVRSAPVCSGVRPSALPEPGLPPPDD
jgi:hypothetical protein